MSCSGIPYWHRAPAIWNAEIMFTKNNDRIVKITETHVGDSSESYYYLHTLLQDNPSTHYIASASENVVVLYRRYQHLKPRTFVCLDEDSAIKFCMQLNDLF